MGVRPPQFARLQGEQVHALVQAVVCNSMELDASFLWVCCDGSKVELYIPLHGPQYRLQGRPQALDAQIAELRAIPMPYSSTAMKWR